MNKIIKLITLSSLLSIGLLATEGQINTEGYVLKISKKTKNLELLFENKKKTKLFTLIFEKKLLKEAKSEIKVGDNIAVEGELIKSKSKKDILKVKDYEIIYGDNVIIDDEEDFCKKGC